MKTNLTKEEKTKITETMQAIVADMFSIYDVANLKTIDINTNLILDYDGSTFSISKHNIKLITYKEDYAYYDCSYFGSGYLQKSKTYVLGTRNFNQTKVGSFDYDLAVQIIKKYEVIRNKIKADVKAYSEIKDTTMSAVDEWHNRFKREALIELDLPKTNNQHTVVVTEENGRTVGTIDFGDKIIKIITDGDIRFVDRREEKAKVKQK